MADGALDIDGQRRVARAFDKERDDEIVEREHEREEGAGDDARQDERKRDAEECIEAGCA